MSAAITLFLLAILAIAFFSESYPVISLFLTVLLFAVIALILILPFYEKPANRKKAFWSWLVIFIALLGFIQKDDLLFLFQDFQETRNTSFKDCSECPEMVIIHKGKFIMGCSENDNQNPEHIVEIGYDFAAGKYEITNAEWNACVLDSGCSYIPDKWGDFLGRWIFGYSQFPVQGTNWFAAHEYIQWLSHKTGHTYRLLSESEWEYAATGGTETPCRWKFYHHDEIDPDSRINRVGRFHGNRFGLYDTAANVGEWVEDEWHENYNDSPADGSAWINIHQKTENPIYFSGVYRGSRLDYKGLSRSKLFFDAKLIGGNSTEGRMGKPGIMGYEGVGFRVAMTPR
jgi:formylglycine-generating enzyme required for sulfatase activity